MISIFEVSLRLCIKYACEKTSYEALKIKCDSLASTFFPDVYHASNDFYFLASGVRDIISNLDTLFDCVIEQYGKNKNAN